MRRLASSLGIAALLLSGGCLRSPSEPTDQSGADSTLSKMRAARYRAQADQVDANSSWRPWFDRMADLDQDLRCTPGMCFLPVHQAAAWDRESLADLGALERLDADPPRAGILPLLVELVRQLESHDIELLLIPIPPQSTVHPELWDPESVPREATEPPPLLDVPLRRLYATLEDHGIEVLDLLPTFLAHQDHQASAHGETRQQLVFRRQDPHWTPYGAHLAAQVVARRVRQASWFAAAARRQGNPQLERRQEWVANYGSTIRRMVRRGRLPREDAEPEWLLQREVRIAGEQWNFDDPSSPILLIGDSFTMPHHGFPDALLDQLGFRVDRVTIPGALPPTLLQALRLRDDGLSGKRLILWVMSSHAFSLAERWFEVEVFPESASTGTPTVAE